MFQALVSYTMGTVVALFPIANPIGAVPIFYALTATNTPSFRRYQARATSVNVVLVLALFFLLGKFILAFFGISLGVLQVAGGLVVSHTAWEMLTVRQRLKEHERQEAEDMEDISFTPMAMPVVSGPGAIGVVIGLAERNRDWVSEVGSLVGIILFGLILYLSLTLGEPLVKRLGKTALGTLNRVLGFFVLAIGVQLIVNGIISLLTEIAPKLLR